MDIQNIKEKFQTINIKLLIIPIFIFIIGFGIYSIFSKETKEVEELEEIPFEIQTKKTPDLFEGAQPYVVNKGIVGQKSVKKLVYEDGKTAEVLEEKVLKKPVNQISIEGSKKTTAIEAIGIKLATDYYYYLADKNWKSIYSLLAPSLKSNLYIKSPEELAEIMNLSNPVLSYKIDKVTPFLSGTEKAMLQIKSKIKEVNSEGKEIEKEYISYGVFEKDKWYIIPDRPFKSVSIDNIRKNIKLDGTVHYESQEVDFILNKMYILDSKNIMFTYTAISKTPFNKIIEDIKLTSVNLDKIRFNPSLDSNTATTKDYELKRHINYVNQGDNYDKKWENFVYNNQIYYKITGRIKISLENPLYFSSNNKYRFQFNLQPETDSNAFLIYPILKFDFTF